MFFIGWTNIMEFKFSSRTIRTKNLCCQPRFCYRQCRLVYILPHFGFYWCSHCIHLNRILSMADFNWHYTRHYLKGSSNYRVYDEIIFASALMYGLLLLVNKFYISPLPRTYSMACGAWWDHLS